jgi:hypothetical protein
MTTVRQAALTAIDLLGAAAIDALSEPSIYYRHLKLAEGRFLGETAVLLRKHEITPVASSNGRYSLLGTRVGRIWSAEFEVNGLCSPVAIVEQSWFHEHRQDTASGGGDRMFEVCRDGTEGIRCYPPLVEGGTLRLFHAPDVILDDRDSRPAGELVAATSTTTAIKVAAPTLGKVDNGSATSRYFYGCPLVFRATTTTPALRGVRAVCTLYNESASPAVFTPQDALPGTPVAGDKFDIQDVISLPERYTAACIDYAAGRVALRIEGFDRLAKQLLTDFGAVFGKALLEGVDPDPMTERFIIDRRPKTGWRYR